MASVSAPADLAVISSARVARAVPVVRAAAAAAVQAAVVVVAEAEPVVRPDLRQAQVVVDLAEEAVAVEAEAAVVAVVARVAARVADLMEPLRSAIAPAADAARNGKPASRTIFRIRR